MGIIQGAIDARVDDSRSLVMRLVREIAPQLDVVSVEFSDSLLDIADIDSLDFLRLVALTAEVTGIVIPPRGIAGDIDFREAAGLDSMDLLNVLTEIARTTGVEVPEADYASVATIDSLAAYLAAHHQL